MVVYEVRNREDRIIARLVVTLRSFLPLSFPSSHIYFTPGRTRQKNSPSDPMTSHLIPAHFSLLRIGPGDKMGGMLGESKLYQFFYFVWTRRSVKLWLDAYSIFRTETEIYVRFKNSWKGMENFWTRTR